jgi:uncharacterized membrane protein YkoI
MNSTRIATVAAAAAIGLFALGSTALAVGNDTSTTAPVLPTVLTGTALDRSTSPTTAATAPATTIDPDQAAGIALVRVGGGRVTGIERELEHGRTEWKVRIATAGTEHEVRVDAGSGAVTRHKTDTRTTRDNGRGDDQDNDRGRDDDHDDHGRGRDDGPGHDVGDDHSGGRGR